MKILVAYATYSGGTQLASQTISDNLTVKGHKVDYKLISVVKPDELNLYDLVVFATPTWDFNGQEGMPHEDFMKFINSSENIKWEKKQFAVIGLGDSSYSNFCGSVDHLENFIKDKAGLLKTPSLKIDGYFFNQESNNQKLTDWAIELVK